MQDDALYSHYQPPLVPIYCCQLLAQPGQHGIQEVLLSFEKLRPDFRQEAAHGLCPRSSLLSWGQHPLWKGWRGCHRVMWPAFSREVGSSTCLAAGIWHLIKGFEAKLYIVVFCLHRKPYTLHWCSATGARWFHLCTTQDAAQAELVVTGHHISDVTLSVVADGATPLCPCGHVRLLRQVGES